MISLNNPLVKEYQLPGESRIHLRLSQAGKFTAHVVTSQGSEEIPSWKIRGLKVELVTAEHFDHFFRDTYASLSETGSLEIFGRLRGGGRSRRYIVCGPKKKKHHDNPPPSTSSSTPATPNPVNVDYPYGVMIQEIDKNGEGTWSEEKWDKEKHTFTVTFKPNAEGKKPMLTISVLSRDYFAKSITRSLERKIKLESALTLAVNEDEKLTFNIRLTGLALNGLQGNINRRE